MGRIHALFNILSPEHTLQSNWHIVADQYAFAEWLYEWT